MTNAVACAGEDVNLQQSIAAVRALRRASYLLQQAGTFIGQGQPEPTEERDSSKCQCAAGKAHSLTTP